METEIRESQAFPPGAAARERYVRECGRGERLLFSGQATEAATTFERVLATLSARPCYERAVVLGRLGYCAHLAGNRELAALRLREALEIASRLQASAGVKRLRSVLHTELGDVLSASGQHAEAAENYEAALRVAQDAAASQLSMTSGVEDWARFGVVAQMLERQIGSTSDPRREESLRNSALTCRQLDIYGRQFVAVLAKLDAPGIAHAVVLGRLGRCFHMAGRSDLAVVSLREAVASLNQSPHETDPALRRMLQVDLATVLRGAGSIAEAKQCVVKALEIASFCQDVRGQASDLMQLGAFALEAGEFEDAATRYRAAQDILRDFEDAALEALLFDAQARLQLPPASDDVAPSPGEDLELVLQDELTTEYCIEPDLLIDGPRELRLQKPALDDPALPDDLRLELPPCARVYLDQREGIHFAVAAGEPVVERLTGCTVIRRKRSEAVVKGAPRLVWRMLQKMDGKGTVADILAELPPGGRSTSARLLAGLKAAGVIDATGRAIASFIHSATKKGTLPAGGLESDEIMTLATDGGYRVYAEANRVPITASIPEELQVFHALTRKRRSQRHYLGVPIGRHELEALLDAACGVTGKRCWAGRETSLRAYPSSGGLYAVEIYPVALRVDGLDQAVFHYVPTENVLEMVKSTDPDAIVAAMLPMERELVAGSAALICLTGNFPRHERKYGQGGYRMLIAEAGHISQNLVLAATALGLAARPFGGVFDGLLNRELGLRISEEEFLLSVVIGRAAVA